VADVRWDARAERVVTPAGYVQWHTRPAAVSTSNVQTGRAQLCVPMLGHQ